MEILVFILGGASYGLLEIIFRGYTHWSMFLTGGAVILTFYIITPLLFNMNIFLAALVGALIITGYEFVVGLIVNRWLGWGVWNYSSCTGNIMGQICPQFSAYWFAICLAFFLIIKYNKYIFYK